MYFRSSQNTYPALRIHVGYQRGVFCAFHISISSGLPSVVQQTSLRRFHSTQSSGDPALKNQNGLAPCASEMVSTCNVYYCSASASSAPPSVPSCPPLSVSFSLSGFIPYIPSPPSADCSLSLFLLPLPLPKKAPVQ